MKWWAFAVCACPLLFGTAHAGTEQGLNAIAAGDGERAVRELSGDAKAGDVRAGELLGDIFAEGLGGVAKDGGAAHDWYFQAARRGHADSQYKLGLFYSEGKLAPRDLRRAEDWFTSASRLHHAKAQLALSRFYFDRGYEAAKKTMRSGSDGANAYYWALLAEHYAKDDPVRKDARTMRERLSPMMPKDVATYIEGAVRQMTTQGR